MGEQVIEIIRQDKYQSAAYSLKATGPPPFFYQIMTFYSREAVKLMSFTVVTAFLILLLFLRSLRGVLVPMTTALSSILWTFGAMGHWASQSIIRSLRFLFLLGCRSRSAIRFHLFNFSTAYPHESVSFVSSVGTNKEGFSAANGGQPLRSIV